MNLRSVLKTYSLLRTLSDDETALLNTLRGMNEGEKELLVSSLSPTPQKKTAKKSSKGISKSPRASSLQAQIQATTNKPRIVGGCDKCGESEEWPIHDPSAGYAAYHPFVSPSSAPRAAAKSSSANGSQSESNPGSGIEKETATAVGGR